MFMDILADTATYDTVEENRETIDMILAGFIEAIDDWMVYHDTLPAVHIKSCVTSCWVTSTALLKLLKLKRCPFLLFLLFPRLEMPEELTEEEQMRARILQSLDDTEYDYHTLPFYGMVPDWQPRYWDLAKMIRQYFSLK